MTRCITYRPTLTFTIVEAVVAETDDGPVVTGRVEWGPVRDQSIRDVLAAADEAAETRTAVADAMDWVRV